MPAARTPESSRGWLWISGGVLAFLIALVLFLRDTDDVSSSKNPKPDSSGRSISGKPDGLVADGSGDIRERRKRGDSSRQTEDEDDPGQRFPMVDLILDDDSLNSVESAQRLLEIAMKEEISDEERQEALAHGLNLDFKSFLAAAGSPSLSVPMAERYLEALYNHNEEPREQILGCLALMNHHDEGICTEAIDQLAFLVENEKLASSPEQLRQAAAAFLEKLAAAPPPPVETPADPEPAVDE